MPDEDPTNDVIAELREYQSPFDDLVGLEYVASEPGRLEARMTAGDKHHQPFGIVHGGVYATVIESVASVGAFLAVRDQGKNAVGVHNATDFIRPHVSGVLRVVGESIHQGRTQQLWQVVVSREEDDKVVARGQVRLAIINS